MSKQQIHRHIVKTKQNKTLLFNYNSTSTSNVGYMGQGNTITTTTTNVASGATTPMPGYKKPQCFI